AHQVERAVFDQRLRDVATEAGVTFRKEEVKEPPAGFDWVVDATGRRRVVGRRWTTYSGHPTWRNDAVAMHFRANIRPLGADLGDITIYKLDGAWFWVIPLTENLTSVGLVTTPARKGLKWDEALLECEELASLLRGTEEGNSLSGH